MDKLIDSKIFKKLYRPAPNSYKNQNGRLLVIAGSKKYHGSLIYSVKAASRIVGLIYILSTRENQEIIKKMKLKTAEFISIGSVSEADFDAVIIGPGMEQSALTYRLTKQILTSNKKAVLDATAINILDGNLKKLLSPNVILAPHHNEFKKAFGLTPTKVNLRNMAKRYRCYIALKGREDFLAEPSGNISINKGGNAGMAKGGSGDVLAGLMAAFLCKNSPILAAKAALFATDKTGDNLFKERGYFYNSEDLCDQLPKTLAALTKLS